MKIGWTGFIEIVDPTAIVRAKALQERIETWCSCSSVPTYHQNFLNLSNRNGDSVPRTTLKPTLYRGLTRHWKRSLQSLAIRKTAKLVCKLNEVILEIAFNKPKILRLLRIRISHEVAFGLHFRSTSDLLSPKLASLGVPKKFQFLDSCSSSARYFSKFFIFRNYKATVVVSYFALLFIVCEWKKNYIVRLYLHQAEEARNESGIIRIKKRLFNIFFSCSFFLRVWYKKSFQLCRLL